MNLFFFRIPGSMLCAPYPKDTELERITLNNAIDCASSRSFGAGIGSTYSRTVHLEMLWLTNGYKVIAAEPNIVQLG